MNACSTRLTRLSMHPFARRGVIGFLVVAAVAAAQFSSFSAGASQDNALVNLAKIREEWVQDLHTKQLEPILKFYAPDAAFLQPNGDRITGSAALRSLFQNIMASSPATSPSTPGTLKPPAISPTTAATSKSR